jgi:SAM-dependent methyltransferase
VASLIVACFAACGAAATLSMSTPWRIVNSVLPVAAASSLSAELPSWIFFVIFVSLLCIYAPAFWTRVPYYPTPRAAYSLILAELPTDRPFTFLDIGCGFGDMLFFLSKHRPNGYFVGIEIGLIPWLYGWLKARLRGAGRVSIRFQNMWTEPLERYDVVYTFLSPAPMEKVWEKVSAEMRPGTLFITNTFEVPAPADEVLSVKDERCSHLFMHRITPASEPRRTTA